MLQFKLIFILFSNEEIKTPWYIKEVTPLKPTLMNLAHYKSYVKLLSKSPLNNLFFSVRTENAELVTIVCLLACTFANKNGTNGGITWSSVHQARRLLSQTLEPFGGVSGVGSGLVSLGGVSGGLLSLEGGSEVANAIAAGNRATAAALAG